MAPAARADLRAANVAVIQACWHKDLVNRCRDACLTSLTAGGVTDVAVIDAGSFEIPLQAKRCADQGRYDAIIAMGLVVDGGIYAHEFVGQAVTDGLMRVQLASGIPVLSAVLTPRAFHESDAHQTFFTRAWRSRARKWRRPACGYWASAPPPQAIFPPRRFKKPRPPSVAIGRFFGVEHPLEGGKMAVGDNRALGGELLAGMGAHPVGNGAQLAAAGLGQQLKLRRPL